MTELVHSDGDDYPVEGSVTVPAQLAPKMNSAADEMDLIAEANTPTQQADSTSVNHASDQPQAVVSDNRALISNVIEDEPRFATYKNRPKPVVNLCWSLRRMNMDLAHVGIVDDKEELYFFLHAQMTGDTPRNDDIFKDDPFGMPGTFNPDLVDLAKIIEDGLYDQVTKNAPHLLVNGEKLSTNIISYVRRSMIFDRKTDGCLPRTYNFRGEITKVTDTGTWLLWGDQAEQGTTKKMMPRPKGVDCQGDPTWADPDTHWLEHGEEPKVTPASKNRPGYGSYSEESVGLVTELIWFELPPYQDLPTELEKEEWRLIRSRRNLARCGLKLVRFYFQCLGYDADSIDKDTYAYGIERWGNVCHEHDLPLEYGYRARIKEPTEAYAKSFYSQHAKFFQPFGQDKKLRSEAFAAIDSILLPRSGNSEHNDRVQAYSAHRGSRKIPAVDLSFLRDESERKGYTEEESKSDADEPDIEESKSDADEPDIEEDGEGSDGRDSDVEETPLPKSTKTTKKPAPKPASRKAAKGKPSKMVTATDEESVLTPTKTKGLKDMVARIAGYDKPVLDDTSTLKGWRSSAKLRHILEERFRIPKGQKKQWSREDAHRFVKVIFTTKGHPIANEKWGMSDWGQTYHDICFHIDQFYDIKDQQESFTLSSWQILKTMKADLHNAVIAFLTTGFIFKDKKTIHYKQLLPTRSQVIALQCIDPFAAINGSIAGCLGLCEQSHLALVPSLINNNPLWQFDSRAQSTNPAAEALDLTQCIEELAKTVQRELHDAIPQLKDNANQIDAEMIKNLIIDMVKSLKENWDLQYTTLTQQNKDLTSEVLELKRELKDTRADIANNTALLRKTLELISQPKVPISLSPSTKNHQKNHSKRQADVEEEERQPNRKRSRLEEILSTTGRGYQGHHRKQRVEEEPPSERDDPTNDSQESPTSDSEPQVTQHHKVLQQARGQNKSPQKLLVPKKRAITKGKSSKDKRIHTISVDNDIPTFS
ncbi:hypothetical protein S40288_11733 [Stachybotrys chartarum IBT 40288]|nr:hypothetical protein S40288_11733 [Stachybotrys chartarum IBT 40288]